MDIMSVHDSTVTNHVIWQEELRWLVKLSTSEFGNCISERELQSHGPDDFYQAVYSAFSICLDWACSKMIVSVAYFAQALTEQMEVKEFMAKNIDSVWLQSTVVLASHLLKRASRVDSKERDVSMQNLQRHRASAFLEIWEECVYPILKDPSNEQWAEKWRGGHIANYAN